MTRTQWIVKNEPIATINLDTVTTTSVKEFWTTIFNKASPNIPLTGPLPTEATKKNTVVIKVTSDTLSISVYFLLCTGNYYICGYCANKENKFTVYTDPGNDLRYRKMPDFSLNKMQPAGDFYYKMLLAAYGTISKLTPASMDNFKESDAFYFFVFLLSECVKSHYSRTGILAGIDFDETLINTGIAKDELIKLLSYNFFKNVVTNWLKVADAHHKRREILKISDYEGII